jgi:hypothetical protein
MDHDLLGYLMNCLDPDEYRRVEEYVRSQPDAARKLERLRQALAPLAADAEPEKPPRSLVLGTLALVAEFECSRPKLPPAPPPRPQERSPVSRDAWQLFRRADVLVAATLLMALTGLTAALIVRVRHQEQIVACKHNLHLWWNALDRYSDTDKNALSFPRVEMEGPRSFAGVFVPLLHDAQTVPPEASVGCPALSIQAPTNLSMAQLEFLYKQNPSEFQNLMPTLSRDYAYSLGYVDNGKLYGLRRDSGNLLPILADRPPDNLIGSSPNHGGFGQNVLYIGGEVRWCAARTVGIGGDDIYVNKQGLVLPGENRNDTVLAPSEATPSQRWCHWNTATD